MTLTSLSRVCSIVLIISIASCISCSEDDQSGNARDGQLVALINDKWTSTSVLAYADDGVLEISAQGSEGSSLLLSGPSLAEGTYPINGSSDIEIKFTPPGAASNADRYSSAFFGTGDQIGKIEITEIDEVRRTISGTFESKVGRANGQIEVKSGEFQKILFSEYVSLPKSSLTAKIDGADLTVKTASASVLKDGTILLLFNCNQGKLALFIPLNTGVGTFNFSSGSSHNAEYTNTIGQLFSPTSGSIHISAHDKADHTFAGTFSFEGSTKAGAAATVSLTEGVLNVHYRAD